MQEEGKTSCQGSTLHYYRGAGKEEEGVEGLGTRLALHATQTDRQRDRREREAGRQDRQMRGQIKNLFSQLLYVL